MSDTLTPITREEKFYDAIARKQACDIEPQTRKEQFLQYIIDKVTS